MGGNQPSQATAAPPREPGVRRGRSLATVVICAYTEARWELTQSAVRSVLGQVPPPEQVVLVVDHNPALAARARSELAGITVLESDGAPGLSAARNTGLRAADQPVTVFLDDDAEARAGWLESLTAPYRDENVVATGGHVEPRWHGTRPRWLPLTFDWVVGCSYTGLPDRIASVRNPIGASMSMRTELARGVGGFDSSVGRVRGKPRGCEETELSIRLTASRRDASILYVPAAVADHYVAANRTRLGYFVRRCWNEGRSKATVAQLAGAGPALERERRHVLAVLPAAFLSDLRQLAAGEPAALARMAAAAGGLTATAAGYFTGRAASWPGRLRQRGRAAAPGAPAPRIDSAPVIAEPAACEQPLLTDGR